MLFSFVLATSKILPDDYMVLLKTNLLYMLYFLFNGLKVNCLNGLFCCFQVSCPSMFCVRKVPI